LAALESPVVKRQKEGKLSFVFLLFFFSTRKERFARAAVAQDELEDGRPGAFGPNGKKEKKGKIGGSLKSHS
jgi:hypothetical protein